MVHSTRLPRLTTLATTGLAAVALTLSMSACSSGSDDAADSASAASDQAVTATADTGADDNAAVPDGFTLVEVPDYDISVAVPSDWDTLTTANTSDTELVGRIAQALDDSEEEVIADLEDTPLTSVDTASDTASDTAVAPYLVLGRIDGEGALPTEDQMRSLAENNDADVTGYEQTTSGSGADAATITLSASEDGTQYYVSALAVSEGDDAYLASVIVVDSEEQLKEISDAMLASL
ncbi:hypothetical protein [Actinomyces succiniciruminis]|uniref:Prokaryotic membrane lipoprotein lipid attachment site profile n=1 Tax=Actinomyces succiniciruminis TaxID=1522002 RepID=A0A1L7RN77_9ACTO|nr:hypothetical protein [Actinomyces succiniciruminis]CED90553.1 Prokaryotic membrane lipoprotein lipid attachment site profile [Actinomyces succiniciruminis]